EQVYNTFLYFFQFKGLTLEVPQKRLLVVLFNEHENYLDYARSLSPSLQSAAGFYDPMTGITYFYDHGSDHVFRALTKIREDMQATKEAMIRNRVLGR